jgi:peroxiredoxin Q/BCP
MVCTKQFCSYHDRADDFAALDATVVGISSQSLDSLRRSPLSTASTCRCWPTSTSRWPRDTAPPHRVWARPSGRAIVIDEDGVVRHRHDHLLGLDYQSVDDLKRTLNELPAAAR